MASEADHIALANRNHDVLVYLIARPTDFPEWITTTAFYKAVQIVEAVFANSRMRPSCNHTDRLRRLKASAQFAPLFKHYRSLLSASCIARYLCDESSGKKYSRFTDYLPAEKVIEKMVDGRLRPVEQHSISLLSHSGARSLKRLSSSDTARTS